MNNYGKEKYDFYVRNEMNACSQNMNNHTCWLGHEPLWRKRRIHSCLVRSEHLFIEYKQLQIG